MRVGTPALDNTHNENRAFRNVLRPLPLADDRDAIARSLWELTNREYRRASPAYAKVMTSTAVQAAEEDKSPDFSKETARRRKSTPPAAPITFNQKEWEDKIRKYSAAFRKYPDIYTSSVTLQIEQSDFLLCFERRKQGRDAGPDGAPGGGGQHARRRRNGPGARRNI